MYILLAYMYVDMQRLVCAQQSAIHTHKHTHAGVWTHVVWTISRSTPTATTGTHKAYINGVLKHTASGNFARIVCTSNYIAKSNFAADAGYVGSTDSLGIYPWVLGLSEATAVFESTGALVCMSVHLA